MMAVLTAGGTGRTKAGYLAAERVEKSGAISAGNSAAWSAALRALRTVALMAALMAGWTVCLMAAMKVP